MYLQEETIGFTRYLNVYQEGNSFTNITAYPFGKIMRQSYKNISTLYSCMKASGGIAIG